MLQLQQHYVEAGYLHAMQNVKEQQVAPREQQRGNVVEDDEKEYKWNVCPWIKI